MSNFSIDIEKFYEELSGMGRQLKGIFCLQYPIFCIHSEISDSTPDPLDNLDKVIVDFIKVKPDFGFDIKRPRFPNFLLLYHTHASCHKVF